jgi:hypothetical protein
MARPNQPVAERDEQKDKFVAYFRDVPVQKYAAMYVGITEQTAIDWMKKDQDFLNRVQEARADWVKKQVYKAKAEFKLERLEKSIFKESKELEVTLPKPILDIESMNVHKDDSND